MKSAEQYPCITLAGGFFAASGAFGIKASGKPDMMLISSNQQAVMAAVMTRSTTCGANIQLNRTHLNALTARAIICNSGNANAATGSKGFNDAKAMAQSVAEHLNINTEEVFVLSTGIIGHHLPMGKITSGIESLSKSLERGTKADQQAAQAILTTDLVSKTATITTEISGHVVHIGGMAKGSGMISPNMATMLGFITTDIAITRECLRAALTTAVNADASFNRITVDTDTSTSDAVMVMANGAAGQPLIDGPGEAFDQFTSALTQVCQMLAYQVIADGEGIEHVIDVRVNGARTEDEAAQFARSVADSPLVKTAVHGKDPNWGRIVMALGKTTLPVNLEAVSIHINDHSVFEKGSPTAFDPVLVCDSMNDFDQILTIDLNDGPARSRVLGCDLSREYITINADYHT